MSRYITSLDGVRALAVLAVLFTHVGVPFAAGGKAGVIVFFVLSGYLITSILLRERADTGRIVLGRFYGRRALRLFPAMIVATAAYVVLALVLGDERTLAAAPAGILYSLNWYNIVSDNGTGMLGHYWSLSVEEQFYFVWPFVLIAAYAVARTRGVFWTAIVGAVASYVIKWTDADSHRQTGTDFAADALLVGCALACLMVSHPDRVRSVARGAFWPAAVAVVAALVLGNSTETATALDSALFARLWWPLAVLGGAVITAACVTGAIPAMVERVLSWRPLVYVGRISYGVYLFHMFVLVVLAHVMPGSGAVAAVRLFLMVALTIGIAALSYEGFERRFLRSGGRPAGRRVDVSASSARRPGRGRVADTAPTSVSRSVSRSR